MTKNTLKIPKVIFADSPKLRANYICFLARQINENFYQTHNYFVLPRFVPHPKTVFFPDLGFSRRFWKKVRLAKPGNVAKFYPDSLLHEIVESVQNINPSPSRESEWANISEKFWSVLISTHLFNTELSKVRSITVHSTTFGTGGSFSFNIVHGKAEILLTIRTDSHISSIATSIIKCLLMIGSDKYRGNFAARQEISTFLFSKTGLSTLKERLHKVSPPVPIKLQLESRTFLAKLGFVKKNPFLKSGSEIIVNNKLTKNHLSPQEQSLFQLLFENKNKTVSYDQIAQTIWGINFEQKFSLWAITKLKEKLDKKLSSLGAKGHLRTIRNVGYSLD